MEFKVGPKPGDPSTRGNLPFDFSRVAIIGNSGRFLNHLVYDRLLNAEVPPQKPGQPPTQHPGIGPLILKSLGSSRTLFQKLILDTNQVNPSSAELQRGEGPNGQPLPGYIVVDDGTGGRRFVQILPMWASDP